VVDSRDEAAGLFAAALFVAHSEEVVVDDDRDRCEMLAEARGDLLLRNAGLREHEVDDMIVPIHVTAGGDRSRRAAQVVYRKHGLHLAPAKRLFMMRIVYLSGGWSARSLRAGGLSFLEVLGAAGVALRYRPNHPARGDGRQALRADSLRAD